MIRCPHCGHPLEPSGLIEFDGARTIRRGRHRVVLSPREGQVLAILWSLRPNPVTREAICLRIFRRDDRSARTNISVVVNRLRDKLQLFDLMIARPGSCFDGYRLIDTNALAQTGKVA